GVPVRIAIGGRDLENGTAEVARRDTKEKSSQQFDELVNLVPTLLDEIQENIFQKALNFREANTTKVDTYDEFKRILDEKPGFVLAHWDGTPETEERIKEETKATIRCIALDSPEEDGVDMVTGKPSNRRVYFARAY
ncbi:MAG: His/Gly/Thr/Pro-type tRNA ligase C-terminal domain-containing protein, partial [Rufibacter sp.]